MPEGHDTIIEVSNIMSFVLYTQILKQSVLKHTSPGITLSRCKNTIKRICLLYLKIVLEKIARRGGAEVAGWTLDRKIRVGFPTYPHRVWALWWQGGKIRLRTSRCPCRGRLDTLKTPSCPWRGCPAAGQNLETGHLSRHYIAEISLNVT